MTTRKPKYKHRKEVMKKERIFRTKVQITFTGYVDIKEVYRDDAIDKADKFVATVNIDPLLSESEGFINSRFKTHKIKMGSTQIVRK